MFDAVSARFNGSLTGFLSKLLNYPSMLRTAAAGRPRGAAGELDVCDYRFETSLSLGRCPNRRQQRSPRAGRGWTRAQFRRKIRILGACLGSRLPATKNTLLSAFRAGLAIDRVTPRQVAALKHESPCVRRSESGLPAIVSGPCHRPGAHPSREASRALSTVRTGRTVFR